MNQQEAARAVLIEVMNVLGAFKDQIVIIGGWTPDLWFPDGRHIGSLDVDLAVSPAALGENAYSTIRARLQDKGYSQSQAPTRFYRNVAGAPEPIKVDLVSGQYAGVDQALSIQVDELSLNTLRGIDLAFEACEEITIEGQMPDGEPNTVRARIVRPEAFLLIKAFALEERAKEKDAYDIAFVLRHFQPSLAELASRLAPLVSDGLGQEAYVVLQEKFNALESVGPTWAARVAKEAGRDYDQEQQAAYQDAQDLFERVRNAGG